MPSPEPNIRHPAAEIGPRAQRAIDRILEAAREVFLVCGYGGASVERIAEAAGVSRATFYTYFPTKRDALLALGAGKTRRARAVIGELRQLGPTWTEVELRAWGADVFAFLDEYGSFGLAWGQAVYHDDELREAGLKTHLETCRRLGQAMNELRGETSADPTWLGLLVWNMFDGVWNQCRLYSSALSPEDAATEIATFLVGSLRPRELRAHSPLITVPAGPRSPT
jgi:AcrR family transcriptional regulator